MSNPLESITTGLMGASTGMQTQAAYDAIAADNKATEWNSAISMQNAAYSQQQAASATERGKKSVADYKRNAQTEMGNYRAAISASGVKVDSGSTLDVQMDMARWGEYEAQTLQYNSALEAYGYQMQAANQTMNAQKYLATMKNPNGYAASSALSGVTELMKRFATSDTSLK